jgi:hypothetical protein
MVVDGQASMLLAVTKQGGGTCYWQEERPDAVQYSIEPVESEGFCHHPLHFPPLFRSLNIQLIEAFSSGISPALLV